MSFTICFSLPKSKSCAKLDIGIEDVFFVLLIPSGWEVAATLFAVWATGAASPIYEWSCDLKVAY